MEAQENFYPGEDEDDDLQKDHAEDENYADDGYDEDANDDDKEFDGSLDTRIGADSDVDDSDAQSAI